MTFTLDAINFTNLSSVEVISASDGVSSGRRFEVKYHDSSGNEFKDLCVMKDLFLKAKELSKTKDVKELADLKKFVKIIETAELKGIEDYEQKDCAYHFRSWFCRLFGGAFWGTHLERLNALELKIDKKTLANQKQYTFSQDVFTPPSPLDFKGTILSEEKLIELLDTHLDIFREVGVGFSNHGTPRKNILNAYNYGVNILDHAPNQDFITAVKRVVTLISQKNIDHQKDLIRALATGFKGCRPGRVEMTYSLLDRLNAPSLGFEAQLNAKIERFKEQVLERMILKRHPNCLASDLPQREQFPHIKSGYKVALADALGLRGKSEAAADQNKFDVNFHETNNLINEYKNLFNQSIDQFCLDIALEVNNLNQDKTMCEISSHQMSAWIGDRIDSKDLDNSFGWYSEDKEHFYVSEKLNKAEEDHRDCLNMYISAVEVKQILVYLKIIV